MNFNSGPIVTLTPTAASFPFDTKKLSLSPKVRVQLESQSSDAPSIYNAIFPSGSLSLSSPHAEIWVQGKQLLIRDRASTYGTYINGIRMLQQTLLEDGDIVTLGELIPRSIAPSDASDSQLKPIEAIISVAGA